MLATRQDINQTRKYDFKDGKCIITYEFKKRNVHL